MVLIHNNKKRSSEYIISTLFIYKYTKNVRPITMSAWAHLLYLVRLGRMLCRMQNCGKVPQRRKINFGEVPQRGKLVHVRDVKTHLIIATKIKRNMRKHKNRTPQLFTSFLLNKIMRLCIHSSSFSPSDLTCLTYQYYLHHENNFQHLTYIY